MAHSNWAVCREVNRGVNTIIWREPIRTPRTKGPTKEIIMEIGRHLEKARPNRSYGLGPQQDPGDSQQKKLVEVENRV